MNLYHFLTSDDPFPDPKPPPRRLLPKCVRAALSLTGHLIGLLVPPFPSTSHISTTRATATEPCLNQPRKNCKRAGRPHEAEESIANGRADIQLANAADDIPEDDEHDGCYDGCGGDEEGVQKDKRSNCEASPARVDG